MLYKGEPAPKLPGFQPALLVVQYIATRLDAADRGPQVRICSVDARVRLLSDGELARVEGPRRVETAVIVIDDSVAEYTCVVRDVAGVAVSESIRVMKPDLDSPRRILV